MTNTGYATRQTTSTRTLILTVMAIILALSLSLLAVQQRANAVTFPGVYTVNSTVDAPDPNHNDDTCDANLSNVPVCTLRAAIEQANAHAGADAIRFAIPGSGVHTIHVNSSGYGELPAISDTVTIDGYTQGDGTPGDASDDATENTLAKGTNAKLKIQLDGSEAGSVARGLSISVPNVVVKGLVINRFSVGIYVGSDAANADIEGNFIGTDPSGTKARSNAEGVALMDAFGVANNTLGGPVPAARNLISGNSDGVYIDGASGNAVYGNLIGTQSDGKSPLGNFSNGVYAQAFFASFDPSENTIGGSAPGYANTIAFNGGAGVCINSYAPGDVRMSDSILSNSIFSNKGPGIDLEDDGVTPNDAGDADEGGNGLQNNPALSSAKKPTSAKTAIKGKLNSTPNQTFRIQFFSNPKGTNEGKKLLFSRSVSTDGTGDVSFTFATKKRIALGQNVTATATSSAGDTSEFSAPRKVVKS